MHPPDPRHAEESSPLDGTLESARDYHERGQRPRRREESATSTILCSSVELYKLCASTPPRASYALMMSTVAPGMFGILWYEVATIENATSWILMFTGVVHVLHCICYYANMQTMWTQNRTRAALYMSSQVCVLVSCIFTALSPRTSNTPLPPAPFIGLAFAILGIPLGVFAAGLGNGDKGVLYSELESAFGATEIDLKRDEAAAAEDGVRSAEL
jgi:hypothetical protein